MNKSVALVITSCDRFDLLEQTLKSFFAFNTYPLNEILLIEDSGKKRGIEKLLQKFPDQQIQLIVNKEKLGQLVSIDKAYSEVKSEYIFHCEDDWEFFEPSFIEKSLEILKENKNILSVWLRDINEYKDITFSEEIFTTKNDTGYRHVYNEILSFNPSLRRTEDYRLIRKYSRCTVRDFERKISDFYTDRKFISAILLRPCIRHLGWHRRVANVHKNKTKIGYLFDSWFKKIKARIYKKFSLGKFTKYSADSPKSKER